MGADEVWSLLISFIFSCSHFDLMCKNFPPDFDEIISMGVTFIIIHNFGFESLSELQGCHPQQTTLELVQFI